MRMARCAARRRKGKHWGVTNKEIEIYTFGMRRALFYKLPQKWLLHIFHLHGIFPLVEIKIPVR